MSPRDGWAEFPSFGGPSPRRRWIVPCCVPGGTRRRLLPCSVGTSTSAPRIASGIVSGTSTSRLSPLRLNTGLSLTWVITNRSPAGPPLRPASPLPASRTREPSRTPAGMLTRYFLTVRTAPVPEHVVQGSSMIAPVPDRKSTRLNSSHMSISYAVFCLKKKNPDHALSYDEAFTATGFDLDLTEIVADVLRTDGNARAGLCASLADGRYADEVSIVNAVH